jgi:hypothetical protein
LDKIFLSAQSFRRSIRVVGVRFTINTNTQELVLQTNVIKTNNAFRTVMSTSTTLSSQGYKPEFMATLYAYDPIGHTLCLTNGNYGW